ncbi:MAG: pyridoxal phosphate-dependent aminotransferase [Sporolactobacillus sp.]
MVIHEQQLADWVGKISTSSTAQLEAKVEQLQRQGIKIYRFGLGQPDFNTPDRAKQAAIDAIEHNQTTYTETGGILPLREAISKQFDREIGVHYSSEEIVVSVGGKQALFNAVCTLCSSGDEVLIPVPYWVSYEAQVKFSGAKPVLIQTTEKTRFKINTVLLEKYVTPYTKLLILNSPNNPTGAVYSKEELAELASFCIAHRLWVISDEVYSSYIYSNTPCTSIASFNGMKDRTIVINAVSKTFSMTGWRIGYSAAPKVIAQAMVRLQSHTTSNPTSISQWAAVAAINGPKDDFDEILQEYKNKRDVMIQRIQRIKGLKCYPSEGAFYLWVDISEWLGETLAGHIIQSADDLAEVLLKEIHVAVMPGNGFGSSNNLRFSFSLPLDEIEGGLKAIETFLGLDEE